MSYKYSVIIPIYKAEKTLRRCVDSLLSQNYTDAEIILVNDGSPDNCGAICEEYAEKYPQVKYICKENGGVSSARNAGLDAASGEYVTFVDSDDWVTEDYFEQLDMALLEHEWDYILFPANYFDGKNLRINKGNTFSVKSREAAANKLAELMMGGGVNSPVTKVYKRSVIEALYLCFNEKLSIAEDWSFNIRYAINAESICGLEKTLYWVNTENESSLSRRIITDYYVQHALAVCDVHRAIDICPLNESERKSITAIVNFGEYRSVYTNAKILQRREYKLGKRLKILRRMCREVNSHNYEIPKTRYCRLISLPVKLRLAIVIDLVAWKLVRK